MSIIDAVDQLARLQDKVDLMSVMDYYGLSERTAPGVNWILEDISDQLKEVTQAIDEYRAVRTTA